MDPTDHFIHESVYVDEPSDIGDGTHRTSAILLERSRSRCNLGRTFTSGRACGSAIASRSKTMSRSIGVAEDDVFCGPSCIPTSSTCAGDRSSQRVLPTLVPGATIGANATIVCGVTIGQYAFIGAGAVVRRDVPDYALMLGVPAREMGWMSRHGHRLGAPGADGVMVCPQSGWRYREVEPGQLRCLDWAEDRPLPTEKG
jgi:UDP-2-acetamido-3-amino-2,3-dideoxy-glucuronate N-acetyltransferase